MKRIVFVLLVIGAVVSNSDALSKKCSSSEDCDEDECCVNYVLVSIFGGRCKKMRLEGESCTPLIKEMEQNPKMHHFQCPCKSGLKCVAKYEIKIGEHIIKHQPECVVPEDDTVAPEPETTPFPEPTPA